MALTLADIDAYVKAMWRGNVCPHCASSDWHTGNDDEIIASLIIGPDTPQISIGGRYLPTVWLACAKCGHIEFIASRFIHLWKEKQERRCQMAIRQGNGATGLASDSPTPQVRRDATLSSGDRGMIERLHGELGGVKQSQSILVGSVGFVSAILIALGIYLVVKVEGLPDRLNDSIREANRAFSDAVATSLQVFRQSQPPAQPQPPVIIQIPPQQTAPIPAPSPAPKP